MEFKQVHGWVLAALGLFVWTDGAMAQGSTSGTGQTTTADVASKVASGEIKVTGTTTTAVDPSTTTKSPIQGVAQDTNLNADGTDKTAYDVWTSNQKDPLHFLNCNGDAVTVETYNSNDTVWWVPYKRESVPFLEKREPKCATSACWLKVNSTWSATANTTGYWVYIDNRLRETNPSSYLKGCKAYVPNLP